MGYRIEAIPSWNLLALSSPADNYLSCSPLSQLSMVSLSSHVGDFTGTMTVILSRAESSVCSGQWPGTSRCLEMNLRTGPA